MAPDAIFYSLLHLLVFAYWLGGDVGVFYASFLLTDEKRAAAGRLAAGKILADVDLAPRFCLILAFPTGLALADARGWMSVEPTWIGAAFAAALGWIFLVWRLHATHGAGIFRAVDLAVRIGFLATLVIAGICGLLGFIKAPMFIAAKFLILAFCIAMGLCVRLALTPFAPAFSRLAAGGAEGDRTIRACLRRARPFVVMIWLGLAAAALLGVATPA